ncbi:MAG: multidrug efflux SMR transporter [Rhodocyclaceae bacterium]|nr:multidrug efflux SMR transporter [Rhodocyclaceae bacterium]
MSVGTAWLVLLAAAACEVGWAVALKYAQGWSRLLPSLYALVLMVASVLLLERAMRVIPVGTAYAVWTGLGAVGTAAAGMWLFDEPRAAARLVSIALILAGIVGLKLSGGAH